MLSREHSRASHVVNMGMSNEHRTESVSGHAKAIQTLLNSTVTQSSVDQHSIVVASHKGGVPTATTSEDR